MPLATVIVGCGNIAKTYAASIKGYPEVELLGFSDLDASRASAFAKEFGGRAYASLEEVLADSAVELVVNLTIHHAHEEVIEQCLRAGKHVHTEKPLALSYAAARRLVALAEEQGCRFSSAPITWMGEAQQAAAAVLMSGELGQVRQVYAEINHGRIESWHPNPVPFYDVGVLWDVGIYPLTLLTALLGPVRGVTAMSRVVMPERTAKDGSPFTLARPDFYVALLDFGGGAGARLSCNFYNNLSRQGSAVEFHGDAGSLILGSSFKFNATVDKIVPGKSPERVPLPETAYDGVEYARGVQDLAQAIAAGRPHRATAAHAAHVIEVLEAIDRSAETAGEGLRIESDFPLPDR
ncbi:MAG: gfo/Idh/MocA family oxidoreductase [Puniceicoccaceae bacterium]|nr:MAG: gfo/Idh/MocA family oxidoreductase [Puniceicoccaceae bacterium]